MSPFTLRKKDVPIFLEALQREYQVLVPKRITESDLAFEEYKAGDKLAYDFVNTSVPPKTLFFRQRETLFAIQGTTHPKLTPPPAEKPMALFGLRSCDASGLEVFERFFSERGFEDEMITGRIRNSLRIALGCHAPGETCFCVCCDGGPFLMSGCDLQLIDLGDRLLVQTATSKGEAAVALAPRVFAEASQEDCAEKDRLIRAVDQTFQRRSYVSEGMKQISLGRLSDEFWERCAADCQGCGGCCFVCPTCSCFSVSDKADGPDGFRRERWRDTCMYEGFTREASGHNPRRGRAERVKRRLFHKLSYQYVEKSGRHGCVGCGRCVITCPAKLGIPDFLSRVHDERK